MLVDDGAQGAPDFTVQEPSDDRAEALTLPVANHCTLQGQAFSEAIRGGKAPRNDLQSAVANMRVIDAIFRAAESRRWEAV